MCVHICMWVGICTHLRVPLCSEDDVRSSGARGTVVCAAQHGCWELNSDPLQVLLHAPTSSEHANPWPSLQCCCC